MLKEEYNKSRPRTECPNCGKLITNACFNKHYNACINPDSKYNLNKTKVVYKLDHTDLCCKFCGEELKSKNALVQHEIRCKEKCQQDRFSKLEGQTSCCQQMAKQLSEQFAY